MLQDLQRVKERSFGLRMGRAQMPVSAQTLQALQEAGVAGDALLKIVRSIDADMVNISVSAPRSAGAERQARYRERKTRDVTGDVTGDVTPIATSDVTSDATRVTNDVTVTPSRAEPLSYLGTEANEKKERKNAETDVSGAKAPDPDADLFRIAKGFLGPKSGGQIAKVKALFGGDVARTREYFEAAAQKDNPTEYVAATIQRHAGRYPQRDPEKSVHAAAKRLCENVANGSVVFGERPPPPMLALTREREREEAARLLPQGRG